MSITNEQIDEQEGQRGSVPAEVGRNLERMREDYAVVEGKPFDYFFCPMLLKDEQAELCMGHVVPQAFDDCCRARVVQLGADIDNWYGTVFESDFVATLKAGGASVRDVVFDEALRRKIQTRILVDEEECGFYAFKGHKPASHTGIALEHASGGDVLPLVLKRSIDEVLADQHRSWKLVVEHDGRVTALVSLIKAAYLSLFRTFGYRYALSASGLAVGRAILGRFYEENAHRSVADARRAARDFFRPYRHMVRPVVELGGGGDAPLGTVEDGKAGGCFGSSGRPYALIVWVRIGADLHAVLMPDMKHPDSAEAYWNFMKNDRETLAVHEATFDRDAGHWVVPEKAIPATWPKKDVSFDI